MAERNSRGLIVAASHKNDGQPLTKCCRHASRGRRHARSSRHTGRPSPAQAAQPDAQLRRLARHRGLPGHQGAASSPTRRHRTEPVRQAMGATSGRVQDRRNACPSSDFTGPADNRPVLTAAPAMLRALQVPTAASSAGNPPAKFGGEVRRMQKTRLEAATNTTPTRPKSTNRCAARWVEPRIRFQTAGVQAVLEEVAGGASGLRSRYINLLMKSILGMIHREDGYDNEKRIEGTRLAE